MEVMFRALDRPDDAKKVLSLELTGAWVNEAREIPGHNRHPGGPMRALRVLEAVQELTSKEPPGEGAAVH